LKPFLKKFHELKIKKGKHLLTPGKNCNFLAFIQQCVFKGILSRISKEKHFPHEGQGKLMSLIILKWMTERNAKVSR
jgi:hypothetical protein